MRSKNCIAAANGSPKKKGKKKNSDSEDDKFNSDGSFESDVQVSPVKERTNARRAATKVSLKLMSHLSCQNLFFF